LPNNSVEFIIEAAMTLFFERGIEDVSLAEIAKQANVSQGLIIYHFKSKANLLFIMSRVIYSKLLKDALESMSCEKNPLQAIHAFVDTFFVIADNNKTWPVFLAKFNPFLRLDLEKFPGAELIFLRNRIYEVLRECVTEGIRLKLFNDVPVDTFISLILSLLWGVCRSYVGEVDSLALSNEIKAILTYRLTGSAAGIVEA